MALINPVHVFLVPFLFVVTVPLAVFASITTLIAFSVLFLRVILVYFDLVLSFLPQSFQRRHPYGIHLPPKSLLQPAISPITTRSPSPALHRRRRRRSSVTSLRSTGSASSLADRGMGLMPTVGPDRDFEGIGGWRVGGKPDDDTWTTVYARPPSPETKQSGRLLHHNRSLSSGLVIPSDGSGGGLMMRARNRSPGDTLKLSMPNSSKARTPPAPRSALGSLDGYFTAVPKSAGIPITTSRKAGSVQEDEHITRL